MWFNMSLLRDNRSCKHEGEQAVIKVSKERIHY